MIRMNQGQFRIESEIGIGSRFIVSLPKAREVYKENSRLLTDFR